MNSTKRLSLSSVLILSAVFGAAGGFLAAFVAARTIDVGRVFFGISGAWVGIVLAPLVGIILYRTVLHSVLYLHELLLMALLAIGLACITAALVRPPGWGSAASALLCMFLFSVFWARRRRVNNE